MLRHDRANDIDKALISIWTELGLMTDTCSCGRAPIPAQASVKLCDKCLISTIDESIRKSIENNSGRITITFPSNELGSEP